MSNSHKVRIIARLRPRIDGEVDDGAIQVSYPSDNTATSSTSFSSTSSSGASYISVPNPRDPNEVFKYPFSSCYDQNSTQEEVFEQDVLPLMDVVYSGVTVTIFAYGVTSSGKTHTMQGSPAQPGVIPRAVSTLFKKRSEFSQYEISLAVSYMEIYKDECYDLLVNRDNAPKLPVRECDGMVFVANLSSIPLETEQEFDAIYTEATKNRSVGATNLNRASSRSHAVLTIEIKMFDRARNTTLTGKLNLVDLAGSENNKMTGNDATRMQESSAINKSLSVLGKVVHALNSGQSRIPYRESKLTRILQDALGGSSVGLLICNLAPGVKFRTDTVNTLKFASLTKKIENKPVVNEHENRPVVKPHFAALNLHHRPQQPGKAALLPSEPIASSSRADYEPQQVQPVARPPKRGRPSLVPRPRVSRISSAYQPMTAPLMQIPEGIATSQSATGSSGAGLSEAEINERIAKAVEAEVARRLAEREQERLKEEEARAASVAAEDVSGSSGMGTPSRKRSTRSKSRSPRKEDAKPLPPGILTPLLKRHKDMDNELQSRLQELEKKYERGDKEAKLVAALSPVSRKKTGRAYVALARAHSEKGDLQVALDLYRKAETYVPDNIKLKERIIEIEWVVNNERPFVPSPKRPARKTKAERKKEKKKSGMVNQGAMEEKENPLSDDQMDVDEIATTLNAFGVELTNAAEDSTSSQERNPSPSPTKSVSPNKRRRTVTDDSGAMGTPAKRAKTTTSVAYYGSDDEASDPLAAPSKGKRKVLAV